MAHLPRTLTLRRFNNFLSVLVVFGTLYIITIPFLPSVNWWVHHEAPLISRSATIPLPAQPTTSTEKNLIIPSLDLQEKIHTGSTPAELKKGVWLRPHTSNPSLGSNTVLAGHRFTYSSSAVFYHLDKMKRGDDIYIDWNGTRYTYSVDEIKVVPPTAVEIEAQSADPHLTLYTCTPLWTATDRLVVIATLKETS